MTYGQLGCNDHAVRCLITVVTFQRLSAHCCQCAFSYSLDKWGTIDNPYILRIINNKLPNHQNDVQSNLYFCCNENPIISSALIIIISNQLACICHD